MEQQATENIKNKLNDLISKYQYMAQVRTLFIIDDLQNIIKSIDQKPEAQTRLEEIQELYKNKFGNIPNNKKNDIQRLSSKL